PDKIARQLWQSLILVLGPPVNDCDVFALDVAGLLQALAKCGQTAHHRIGRPGVEKSDHGHCWLRPRRGRPCGGAADERNKLASSHSITSSARCWSCTGTSRPRALAVSTRASGDPPETRRACPARRDRFPHIPSAHQSAALVRAAAHARRAATL